MTSTPIGFDRENRCDPHMMRDPDATDRSTRRASAPPRTDNHHAAPVPCAPAGSRSRGWPTKTRSDRGPARRRSSSRCTDVSSPARLRSLSPATHKHADDPHRKLDTMDSSRRRNPRSRGCAPAAPITEPATVQMTARVEARSGARGVSRTSSAASPCTSTSEGCSRLPLRIRCPRSALSSRRCR